mmetsp:Transcript_28944/g.72127  ORF Transcript_28944/g.72127 Transcript_28944/m.72127 type:complete len:399 (-) Transcript_28944:41-1237(-)
MSVYMSAHTYDSSWPLPSLVCLLLDPNPHLTPHIIVARHRRGQSGGGGEQPRAAFVARLLVRISTLRLVYPLLVFFSFCLLFDDDLCVSSLWMDGLFRKISGGGWLADHHRCWRCSVAWRHEQRRGARWGRSRRPCSFRGGHAARTDRCALLCDLMGGSFLLWPCSQSRGGWLALGLAWREGRRHRGDALFHDDRRRLLFSLRHWDSSSKVSHRSSGFAGLQQVAPQRISPLGRHECDRQQQQRDEAHEEEQPAVCAGRHPTVLELHPFVLQPRLAPKTCPQIVAVTQPLYRAHAPPGAVVLACQCGIARRKRRCRGHPSVKNQIKSSPTVTASHRHSVSPWKRPSAGTKSVVNPGSNRPKAEAAVQGQHWAVVAQHNALPNASLRRQPARRSAAVLF